MSDDKTENDGNDVAMRKKVLDEIVRFSQELEQRVMERTRELDEANHMLFEEIQERKQAERVLRETEEKYNAIMDHIAIGISLISPSMEILALNRQMKIWFPEIDLSKRPICYRAFNCPPREDICSYCPTVKALKDGEVYEAVTETPAGGGIRRYRVLASPVKDEDGRTIAAIEMVEDLTEKKRLEEELQKAQKLESIGILAGGIAHDYNNLLMIILGNVSFAKMYSTPGDKIFGLLDAAEKGCEQAKELADRLLTFSKGGEPIREAASIHEVLNEALALALNGSDIKREISIPEGLYTVEIDRRLIKQVFRNIFVNAREAMPDGGIIRVKAENTTEGYLKVSVTDTGTGIPKENMSKIFDPYFTTKEMGSEKGMGLGLTVCHSIIKKHGGFITVESEQGAGTTFNIFLPASLAK